MLALNMAIDPQYGGQAVSKFAQGVLETLKPEDSAYISDTTFQGHCDAYKATTSLKNDICVQYDDHIYQVQPCKTDAVKNTCVTAAHSDSMCEERPAGTYPNDGLDKDFCTSNAQCKTSLCVNYRCEGLAENADCIGPDDEACQIGLACIKASSQVGEATYKCQAQAATGEACANDIQCQNGNLCVDSKCVAELSVAVGETVNRQCPSNDYSTICASSQCVQKTDSSLVCIDGYKTEATVPKETTDVNDCVAKTTSSGYQDNYQFGEILCARSKSAGSYCSAKLGDALGQTMITAAKAIVGKTQGKCHYLR